MANPQLEQGHIRIANELYDEILRRNFSKRQQNLVLFIWRLSYGTGQKDCEVKQFNLFELSGIYKSDIKKELNYLRDCAVLNWNEKDMIFSINKNYKLWQISPNKNWDSDKFKELIHYNLSRKSVSKTLTKSDETVSKIPTIDNPKVSKTLTFKSKQVSKLLTPKLVKYQPTPSLNLRGSRGPGSLKTLLKTLKIKDIKDNNYYKRQTASEFYEQNGFGMIGGYSADMLMRWMAKFDDEILILAMKEAIENDAKNWRYLNKILGDWADKGVKSAEDAQAAIAKFRDKSKRSYSQPQKQEIIPDWFKNRKPIEDKQHIAPVENIDEILNQFKQKGAVSK